MKADDVLTAPAVEFLHVLQRGLGEEREEILAARPRARSGCATASYPTSSTRREPYEKATGAFHRRRRTSPTAASRSPARPTARW